MRADEIRLLFDYAYAATGRVLDAAGRLTPDQFVAPAPVSGTSGPRDILVHTLDTERARSERLRAGGLHGDPVNVDPADFPDVPSLAREWRADEERMRAVLDTLDDEALDAPAAGGYPLWLVLTHVVNHGTQHRSEVAMILTSLGQSPGDLDLPFYLRGWSDD